jgi:radical SAM superfamily enzyme YgiQ (UPF0313 family)
MNQLDVLFCSAPGTFSSKPTLAPAILNACAKLSGFKSTAIDLNIEVINRVAVNPNRQHIENFFKLQIIDDSVIQDIGDLIEYSVDRIVATGAKILGLSLLTQDSQFFTVWLCYHLKTICPNIKIVIGGSGIKNFIAESTIGFGELLKRKGYIDDYINGDGEHSIVEYLKNNLSYPGINSGTWKPIVDLNQLPIPDFGDYNFAYYADAGIPICDSRGCVRTCEFCDIIEHWKKYQYRTADNIFTEMLEQIQRHGISRFFFYNSLTNGNMKEFHKLLDLICNYNDQNTQQPISWEGYFIVRNQKQHPSEFWAKIKKSNGTLQLGIESVIEKVRIGLGKNFTNDDIDYHLDMAQQYSVPIMLLLIVGYPTETKEDFEFTKQWFRQRKHYAKNSITSVVLSMASILPNTQLEKNQSTYGIVRGEIPTIWLTQTHNIDTQDRLNHFDELTKLLSTMRMYHYNSNDNNINVINQELNA